MTACPYCLSDPTQANDDQSAALRLHKTDATVDTCTCIRNLDKPSGEIKGVIGSVNYEDADMRSSKIIDCTLTGNVTGCDFDESEIANTKFTKTNLSYAYARHTTMRSVTFDACNMSEACMSKSHIIDTQFCNTIMRGATAKMSALERVSITHGSLSDAEINALNATDCTFSDTKIVNAVAKYTRWEKCTLRACNMNHANFENSLFRRCVFDKVEMSCTSFSEAAFIQCTLINANFAEAVMDGALYEQCDLRGASFDEKLLSSASLVDCDLRGASFRNAQLGRANLSGSDLSDADLSGASYDDKTIWPVGFQVTSTMFHRKELDDAQEVLKGLQAQHVPKDTPISRSIVFTAAEPRSLLEFMYQAFPGFFFTHQDRWAIRATRLVDVIMTAVDHVQRQSRKGDGIMPFGRYWEQYACILYHMRQVATDSVIRARYDVAESMSSRPDTNVIDWLAAETKASMRNARPKRSKTRPSVTP